MTLANIFNVVASHVNRPRSTDPRTARPQRSILKAGRRSGPPVPTPALWAPCEVSPTILPKTRFPCKKNLGPVVCFYVPGKEPTGENYEFEYVWQKFEKLPFAGIPQQCLQLIPRPALGSVPISSRTPSLVTLTFSSK